jgi:hypothetical protein
VAGDAAARAIVTRQEEEIEVLVLAAARRLGLVDREVEVVLGGGQLAGRDGRGRDGSATTDGPRTRAPATTGGPATTGAPTNDRTTDRSDANSSTWNRSKMDSVDGDDRAATGAAPARLVSGGLADGVRRRIRAALPGASVLVSRHPPIVGAALDALDAVAGPAPHDGLAGRDGRDRHDRAGVPGTSRAGRARVVDAFGRATPERCRPEPTRGEGTRHARRRPTG